MIMHPLGQSLLVPAGPHLATSLTGSFRFESSACSPQWAEGYRDQLSGWEELSGCASMPNLRLAWGTWSSWFSDGFLEGNQSDLFSIFLTHRVRTCIHRSKVVYKWTKNLSSFLGGKKASSCHIHKHPYSACRCGGSQPHLWSGFCLHNAISISLSHRRNFIKEQQECTMLAMANHFLRVTSLPLSFCVSFFRQCRTLLDLSGRPSLQSSGCQ